MGERLQVGDVEVWVDGQGPETLLMLHGWPDTHRLWDDAVARLSPQWRCARFTWPGFELGGPRRARTLDELVELLRQVVERLTAQAGSGRKVTLLLHDWGCVFGYQFAMRHPSLVARVIGVDVGDAGSRWHRRELGGRAKAGIAAYQLWLALAWRLGGALGDRMSRAMARWLRAPGAAADIHAGMAYPYDMAWTGSHGGLRQLLDVAPGCPMLYLYGRRKPLQFQSRRWTEALAAQPGNRVMALPTGHWVMVEQPEAFAQAVRGWLLGDA